MAEGFRSILGAWEGYRTEAAQIDAYNREDSDAFVKDAAPGFELDFSRAVGPWRGVFGLDQARRVVEEFQETWESDWVEPHEFIEAGDHVVMPGTQHLKGRDGIEVVVRATFVFTIRNGAIERNTMYQEKEDALEALGLSEQDAHSDS
jgi:ketosteroid isomerase-like protein